jgi:hypothetical protein
VSFGSDIMSSLAAPIPIVRARAFAPGPHHNCNTGAGTSSWFDDFAMIENGCGCGVAPDVESPTAAAAAAPHPPVSLPSTSTVLPTAFHISFCLFVFLYCIYFSFSMVCLCCFY